MTGQVKLLQVNLSYDMLSHFGIGQVRQVKFDNFWTKILLGLQFFLSQNFVEPEILLDPKHFWTKNVVGPKIFEPTIFGPKCT